MIIDDWLIGRYQSLVDWSQKKPNWWIEQCGFGLGIAQILAAMFDPSRNFGTFVILIIGLICAVVFVTISRDVTGKAMLARQDFRLLMLVSTSVFGLIDVFFILVVEKNIAYHFAGVFINLFFTSPYYFAVCEDPKPPVRKEKLVPQL